MPLSAQDIENIRSFSGSPVLPQNSGQYAIAETIPRKLITSNAVAIAATGVLFLVSIMIPGDVLITNIHFGAGGTSEGTGTHAWLCLYDQNLRLMGQGADNTGAAAVGLGAVFTQAISGGPVKTAYSGLYYVGIMVAATTMPTAAGIAQTANVGLQALTPFLSGTSTSSLTNVAPATANALTSSANIPYMFVS